MTKYQNRLTDYQTHKLIKSVVPSAVTVYETKNHGQYTFEEYLDLIDAKNNQF